MWRRRFFFIYLTYHHIMGTEKIVLNESGTQPQEKPLHEIFSGSDLSRAS